MNARAARKRRAFKHLPRIDLLMFPTLARERLGGYPVDEHAVTRSMHSLTGISDIEESEQLEWFEGMLRTAALYVVDTTEADHAITDAIDLALTLPDEQQTFEMPPLPMSRIAIEGVSLNQTWRIPASDGYELSIDGVLIDEVTPGQHWRTMALFFPAVKGSDRTLDMPGLSVYGDIRLAEDGPRMGRIKADEADPMAVTALETMYSVLVNLITAKGVAVSDWPDFKSTASPAIQKHAPRFARPYWVSLSQSGQERPRTASDRTYHCRWLVSGHWRHYESGDRTWIRPYVKGPKGAPWKGRPVHVVPVLA